MNDFINKYKNATKGIGGKKQNKDAKNSLNKALNTAFKMAMEGKVSGVNHEGQQYLIARADVFDQVVKNGGLNLVTPEQQEFHKNYQLLLHMMNSLNMEVDEEADLFADLDQFTFDFSQNMNNPNKDGAKIRKRITDEFFELINSSELAKTMEENLRKQMFPTEEDKKDQKPENSGKLT